MTEASHELDEQLADFFEKTISDKERDRLMSLPSDEMYESLSDQYTAYLEAIEVGRAAAGRPPRPRGRRPGPPGLRRPALARASRREGTPAGKRSKGN